MPNLVGMSHVEPCDQIAAAGPLPTFRKKYPLRLSVNDPNDNEFIYGQDSTLNGLIFVTASDFGGTPSAQNADNAKQQHAANCTLIGFMGQTDQSFERDTYG